MTRTLLFLLLTGAIGLPPARASSETPMLSSGNLPAFPAWISLDVPLWDIADEGLPFRLTYARPHRREWIAAVVGAEETRWSVSAGYAKVYNSYDGATGIFKNPGGHAALFSAGIQWYWRLPQLLGEATPRLLIEAGAHYATRRFPADGTRANFKLITGLEWVRRARPDAAGWSVSILWPHFSNANLFDRNAGYDGLALRFARTVTF